MDIFLGVLVLGLLFAFVNGFHDTGVVVGNAVATRALRPGPAIVLATGFTLVGALLGQGIADAMAAQLMRFTPDPRELLLVCVAGLAAGVLVNGLGYLIAMPASATHCLFGGLVGAAVVFGFTHVPAMFAGSFLAAILLAPLLAGIVSLVVTRLLLPWLRSRPAKPLIRGFRMAGSVSVALLAVVHAMQDAQKIGAVLFICWAAAMAANGNGTWPIAGTQAHHPVWLLIAVALALSIGTACSGWRVARTVSMRSVSLEPIRATIANSVSSLVLYMAAMAFRAPLPTSWVVVGANLGTQIGDRPDRVRMPSVLRIGGVWLFTVPVAAGCGALAAWPLLLMR